jgi:phosphatidylserine/phosphatidylglycerophosphate/cardiolipin synthase-like enzyme
MQLFLQMNFAYSHIEFTKNCEKNVIKLIENSKESIDIAVYSINNLNIVEALLDAKERGVKVRILTDRIQAFGKSSKAKLLRDVGFEIKIHSKQRIMHHKFAIFDGKNAVEGSFNWTYSAANKNAEDCNIFDKAEDIQALQKRFKMLWKLNSKEVSECYFANMKLKKENRKKCNLITVKTNSSTVK